MEWDSFGPLGSIYVTINKNKNILVNYDDFPLVELSLIHDSALSMWPPYFTKEIYLNDYYKPMHYYFIIIISQSGTPLLICTCKDTTSCTVQLRSCDLHS